ncbi:hypothetical protein RCG17_01180 [Neobacillus sp. PS3-12]|uniref:hypothetical protein n=1 Tax=Neobacillus sp. PS3-12 TaxID=3070677 RepID=UPI0027E0E361|nr:hypothetical protein [Neobacillus sp. PS3-12]WML53350.1 hypothetical protein RCG17_01180 [Neobacillus sp. PS3-12]
MTVLNEQEATFLLHSHGIKCDKKMVKQWLIEGKIKGTENIGSYIIEEEEVFEFLETYRWEGTAYEKGIDNETKIKRLLEEIADYKKRIEDLEQENYKLMDQLGILPF